MTGARSGFRWFLLMAAVFFLLAACAKKPYVDGAGAIDGASAGVAVSGTGAPGYGDQFGEEAITEEGGMAAAHDGISSSAEGFQGIGAAVPGLERIFFDFDRYTLGDEARAILARNAAYLQAHPQMKIIIEGHCDDRGSDEYNLALGERRARAVQGYLVNLGIPVTRTRVISYGEEIPLDRSGTEAAHARNRRVEFKEDR